MKTRHLKNKRGQIVVEYVLLLVIAVAVAALITKELVHRDPDSPGVLIKKWDDILKEIGKDLPDKTN